MCLDYPIYHEWKQDGIVQWRDDLLETCNGKDDDCFCEYEFTDDEISNTSYSEDRWYYDNVDATTDVDLCTFNF